MNQPNQPKGSKEPFISGQDRPDVKIDPETRVTDLRVRDLQSILQGGVIKKIEIKEFKFEKFEKLEKFEKPEFKDFKDHKFEKFEKHEWKELKLEKLEVDGVIKPGVEPGPDPTKIGDPEIRNVLGQLIQSMSGLASRVDQLSNQVAELQKKVGG